MAFDRGPWFDPSWKNQEAQCDSLPVDHKNMAVRVTSSGYEGLKQCCLSSAMDGTDHMLWNVNEEDGNVSIECEEGGSHRL